MQKVELRGGIYSTSLGIASAGSAMIWPSAPLVGYALLALALTLAVWGIQYRGVGLPDLLRGKEARRVAYAERTEFDQEKICVNDLVNDAVPHVVRKTFRRCVITGPASVVMHDGCCLDYASAQRSPFWEADAGTDLTHAVIFRGCIFDRCFFGDDLLIMADRAAKAEMDGSLLIQSRAEWAALRHCRKLG